MSPLPRSAGIPGHVAPRGESHGARRYAIITDVPAPNAELSSLATTLGDLRKRVTAMADRAAAEDDDDTASELFAVERALTGAERRLGRISSGGGRRR